MDKLRIIHLVPDEKFIDVVIRMFDACRQDVDSRYYCMSETLSNSDLKFIKQKERIQVVNFFEMKVILQNVNEYDLVFLHSLIVVNYSGSLFFGGLDNIIRKLPKDVKVMWASWGADLYSGSFPLVRLDLLAPKTRTQYLKPGVLRLIHSCAHYVRFKKNIRLLRRIDYCSTVLPYEYDLLKSQRPFLKAKQVPFHYSDPKKYINMPRYVPQPEKDCNILLGNSSAITCNHLDVLCRLNKIKLGSKKVYVPLSYGNKRNALFVCEQGERLLSSNFEPLLDFMPYEQYQKIFDSCSSAIYANIRQQAMGNIHLAFRKGLKVFFSEKASFIEHFQNRGYKFFLIEKDLNEEELNSPLATKYAEQNYDIWRQYAGKSQKDFEDMIDLFRSDIERERNK